MRNVIAIVNPSASSGSAADRRDAVRQALHDAGVKADVHVANATSLPGAVREAMSSAADAVVVGGDDGTLSTAAGVMVDGDKPLGVLPLGTLNHFAKDLGLPLELEEAARTIAAGAVQRIDVASVNQRVFLNNSSIGIYPQVISEREHLRASRGHGKWSAFALAMIAALRRYSMLEVRCVANDSSLHRLTPFVFVGNNLYSLSGISIGGRESLESGRLCIYLADRTGPFGLMRLALRALLGRARGSCELAEMQSTELTILSRRQLLRVATDGEVQVMQPPLRYRIHPRALPVLVPPPRDQ